MANHNYDWVKDRIQIISMIEYLDSIYDGSKKDADRLKEINLKLEVGSEEVNILLDADNFSAVYNMLLTLRDINSQKMN